MKGTKRKTIYGKTQAEVRDKLTKALSDRIDGIVYDDENMTVGEYLDVLLKGAVYGSVRQSTHDRDTNLVNNHIRPALGGLKLKKLNSAHVQGFYSALFCTDGLVEAHDPKGAMFGSPRLRSVLSDPRLESGRGLSATLMEELKLFTGEGWEQEDDITLLTLRRSAPLS